MPDKPESSSGFLFMIAGLGVASSLVVIFALRVFSQREGSDSLYANNGYPQVQQTATIKIIRKAMAEELTVSLLAYRIKY